MDFYIGLGGIGCRALYRYAKTKNLPKDTCFYIDVDAAAFDSMPDANAYLVKNLSYGSGTYRNIGRSAILHEIYCGSIRDYFQKLFDSGEVSLKILTSSFGGFGGGAAAAVMDYLQANTWRRQKELCSVYALTESVFRSQGFPQMMINRFESNTLEFVRDFSDRVTTAQTPFLPDRSSNVFVSQCRLWLLDSGRFPESEDFGGADILCRALDMDEEQLAQADVKTRYAIKPLNTESPYEVFVSYSFQNQAIADQVVEAIEKRGVRCWIAKRDMKEGSYPRQIMQQIRSAKVFLVLLSKESMASEQVKNELDRAFSRLKEGLCFLPLRLDDTDLDDECMYYLCRQEIFSATKPPLAERIEEMALIVEKIVKLAL